MVQGSRKEAWEGILERCLEPFLAVLGHKAQRRWAPVYLRGLLGPGERKSVEPRAGRSAPNASANRRRAEAEGRERQRT